MLQDLQPIKMLTAQQTDVSTALGGLDLTRSATGGRDKLSAIVFESTYLQTGILNG